MADTDKSGTSPSPAGTGKLNPGDDAPPGAPGTGEDVCPQCSGSGKVQGAPCQTCGGTGTVIKGVAGG